MPTEGLQKFMQTCSRVTTFSQVTITQFNLLQRCIKRHTLDRKDKGTAPAIAGLLAQYMRRRCAAMLFKGTRYSCS